MMRFATWQDPEGRRWRTLVPEGAPDADASLGIPAGPPDLSSLGLPEDIEVRLHNALFERRLFDWTDVRKHGGDVTVAMQSALKLDVQRILLLYRGDTEG